MHATAAAEGAHPLPSRERTFLLAGLLALSSFVLIALQAALRTGVVLLDDWAGALALAQSQAAQAFAVFGSIGASNRLLFPMFLGVAGILWWQRRRQDAVVLVALLVATQATVHLLKVVFAIERPDTGLIAASGYAFPSGHTANGALCGGLLAWYGRDRIAVAAGFAWALAIGASRMVGGVHTLTDVLGGLALGLAFSCAGLSLASAMTLRHVSVGVSVPVGQSVGIEEKARAKR